MNKIKIIFIVLLLATLVTLPLSLLISDNTPDGFGNTTDGRSAQGDFSMKLKTVYSSTMSAYSEKTMGVFFITNNEELNEIHGKYLRTSLDGKLFFKPNFDKEVLVAIFMGRRTSGGHSIEAVNSALVRDESINIEVVQKSPAPGTMVTMQITSPCVVVSIKKDGLKFFNRVNIVSNNDLVLSKEIKSTHDLSMILLMSGILSKYKSSTPLLLVIDNDSLFKDVLEKFFANIKVEQVIKDRATLKKVEDFSFKKYLLILSLFGEIEHDRFSNMNIVNVGADVEGDTLVLYSVSAGVSVMVESEKEDELLHSPFSFVAVDREDIKGIKRVVLKNDTTKEIIAEAKISNDLP